MNSISASLLAPSPEMRGSFQPWFGDGAQNAARGIDEKFAALEGPQRRRPALPYLDLERTGEQPRDLRRVHPRQVLNTFQRRIGIEGSKGPRGVKIQRIVDIAIGRKAMPREANLINPEAKTQERALRFADSHRPDLLRLHYAAKNQGRGPAHADEEAERAHGEAGNAALACP
ncbi:MAG: hypothetical protein ABL907_25090 [Hyphomicrobium sp.]